MLYMVIEHYRDGVAPEVFRRFRERGRMAAEDIVELKVATVLTNAES